MIFTAGTICMSLGMLFAGYLGDKIDKLKFLLVGYIITVPLALGLVLSPILLLSAPFYVGRATLANMTYPVGEALFILHITNKTRGKAFGITTTMWGFSRMIGSGIGGHLFDRLHGWVFVTAAVMYTCAIVYLYHNLKEKKVIELN
jgi:MFS family permease